MLAISIRLNLVAAVVARVLAYPPACQRVGVEQEPPLAPGCRCRSTPLPPGAAPSLPPLRLAPSRLASVVVARPPPSRSSPWARAPVEAVLSRPAARPVVANRTASLSAEVAAAWGTSPPPRKQPPPQTPPERPRLPAAGTPTGTGWAPGAGVALQGPSSLVVAAAMPARATARLRPGAARPPGAARRTAGPGRLNGGWPASAATAAARSARSHRAAAAAWGAAKPRGLTSGPAVWLAGAAAAASDSCCLRDAGCAADFASDPEEALRHCRRPLVAGFFVARATFGVVAGSGGGRCGCAPWPSVAASSCAFSGPLLPLAGAGSAEAATGLRAAGVAGGSSPCLHPSASR